MAQLCAHSDKLNSLAGQWDHFERDVKNLLNWIMDEANRFSGEVTTQGDKGIEDHIESCKVGLWGAPIINLLKLNLLSFFWL